MATKTVTDIARDVVKVKPELSMREARDLVDATFASVREGVKKQGRVRTPLGSFRKHERKAVKGGEKRLNAFTGEMYVTKAKPKTKVPKFSANRDFKESLSGSFRKETTPMKTMKKAAKKAPRKTAPKKKTAKKKVAKKRVAKKK